MIGHYRRLVAWDRWANGEAAGAIRAAGGDAAPAAARRLLAHVAAAERLWLGRLALDPTPVPVWPEWPFVETLAVLAGLEQRWDACFDALTPERLEEAVAYTNTKGERWTNTVGDVLSHVVTHSAYHRGQIATALRAAGHAPAYTDFIHAVRQGLV
ncbi:MAG TPA: DinB family protein [Gemmatimonadales bacterium]|nr:DinB family protein [Gemmatimonadales bacterium]